MSELVLVDRIGAAAVLTLNRPQRHNSLVPDLLGQMLLALESVGSDLGARAVVLQANGRSFSTGGDILGFREHLDHPARYAHEIVGLLNQVVLAMLDLPKPIVAAVHGAVTGGSMGLVLGADLVLVAPEASFAPYYSVLGFSPDGGWTCLLPGIIGRRRTAEVLLRNLTIGAEQAVDWGLASCIVAGDEIRREALILAQELAERMPGSLSHTKRLLGAEAGDVANLLESERRRFVQQITTEEARQGIQAFLQAGRKASSRVEVPSSKLTGRDR